MTFLGFAPADFDAFLPKKQGSNAYTLERRRAKDKLLEIARRLRESSPKVVAGLELETTEDAPSVLNGRRVRALAAYFVRPAATRSGLKELLATDLHAGAHLFEIAVHQQHAHLELRIDNAGITTGVRIPGGARVDRENVAEKLKLDWAREELAGIVQALPDGTRVGYEGELSPALDVTPEALGQWGANAEEVEPALVFETFIGRDDPELATPAWGDEGTALMARFLPTLRFLAWSKENDHTRVQEVVAKKVGEAAPKSSGIEAGARVTILGGLFAGRGGYVVELDHKGKAKVMVGPVTITVEASELKPAG